MPIHVDPPKAPPETPRTKLEGRIYLFNFTNGSSLTKGVVESLGDEVLITDKTVRMGLHSGEEIDVQLRHVLWFSHCPGFVRIEDEVIARIEREREEAVASIL